MVVGMIALGTGIRCVGGSVLFFGPEVWTTSWGKYSLGAAMGRSLTMAVIITVLQVGTETAAAYAQLRLALRRRGQPIPANDAWIAALALQHGLPVLTRDAHFDAVAGLTRVGW